MDSARGLTQRRAGDSTRPLPLCCPGASFAGPLPANLLVKLLAIPEGLEPPTNSLEGCCSIQLSYGTLRRTSLM